MSHWMFLKKLFFVVLFCFAIVGVLRPSTSLVHTSVVQQNSWGSSNITGGRNTTCTQEGANLLGIVSFNIAGLQASEMAPEDWKHWNSSFTEDAVIAELLRSKPVIVALQECPSQLWAQKALAPHSYSLVESTPSHAGYVSLVVRSDLTATAHSWVENSTGPLVAATVTWGNTSHLVVAVHLEPFERNSRVRYTHFRNIQKEFQEGSWDSLLIAGDTNMRDSESEAVEGLGFLDAWKEAGADEKTRYSWDTVLHNYGEVSEWQNMYYGTSTREYQRRYDRLYIATTGARQLRVNDFSLLGNHPIPPSRYHFLSDHFGIAAELQLL